MAALVVPVGECAVTAGDGDLPPSAVAPLRLYNIVVQVYPQPAYLFVVTGFVLLKGVTISICSSSVVTLKWGRLS